MGDRHDLPCPQARTGLSPQLDREGPGLPAGQLTAHLAACGGCRDWLVRVTAAVRRVPDAPDLTGRIVAGLRREQTVRIGPRAASRHRPRPTRMVRYRGRPPRRS